MPEYYLGLRNDHLGNMFTDRMQKYFDHKYGTVVLALTPNVAYIDQKAQVLEFIADNSIKASYIYLDDKNHKTMFWLHYQY